MQTIRDGERMKRSFFSADGQIIDATQEMMTLGLCNIVGSFFRSMPVSGSFSRSAVNNASGVKTPLGGLYTGCLIVLALGLLTPYFYYIPKASLASVLVTAVLFMVEIKLTVAMWKTKSKPGKTTRISPSFLNDSHLSSFSHRKRYRPGVGHVCSKFVVRSRNRVRDRIGGRPDFFTFLLCETKMSSGKNIGNNRTILF